MSTLWKGGDCQFMPLSGGIKNFCGVPLSRSVCDCFVIMASREIFQNDNKKIFIFLSVAFDRLWKDKRKKTCLYIVVKKILRKFFFVYLIFLSNEDHFSGSNIPLKILHLTLLNRFLFTNNASPCFFSSFLMSTWNYTSKADLLKILLVAYWFLLPSNIL